MDTSDRDGANISNDANHNKPLLKTQTPRWKRWTNIGKKTHDDISIPPLPYWKLFRYTNFFDRFMLLISMVFAVIHGAMLPILTLVFGRAIDEFGMLYVPEDNPSYMPPAEVGESIGNTTQIFLILSFVSFVVSSIQLFFALRTANSIGNTLRTRFFNSLIRQQASFYDDAKAGALTNLVVSDINMIQAGIGDKLATAVQYVTTFAVGVIVGFIKGWSLTLVILAVTPILLISGFIFGNASSQATGDSLGSYAEAGGVASEVLGLIRTVTAFGGQESEAARYDAAVEKAYRSSARSAVWSGVGLGTAMFFILATYGLAFWFGSTRVNAEEMKVGDVLITFFALTLGASSLGTAGPAFKSFSKARAAAPRVFDIIDTISGIDPLDNETGSILPASSVQGQITFDGVYFDYPNRRKDDDDTGANNAGPVLENFSYNIDPGSSEALVGKSGCGKSTVARLIQRLYDPLQGAILLDGVNIRQLNTRWLRSQIGVVTQTPSLFMLSIRDNIALGAGVSFERDESSGKTMVKPQEVTEDDIVAAARLANAHDFILKLPEGYKTMLGERGALLSGGQKQRICIARALVRHPKILVLDESTASLDTESEHIVQKALEQAAEGRTTVTIAHRLSTVRNATSISCIQEGHVVERGNHDNLIRRQGGFYHRLFELQNIEREKMEREKIDGSKVGLDSVTISPAPLSKCRTEESKTETEHLSKKTFETGVAREKDSFDKGIFWKTLKLNADEWPFLILGSVGAVASAVTWPLSALVLVEMIDTLLLEPNNAGQVRKWSLGFVVLAVIALFGNGMQHGALGISGERLTKRLRSVMFRKLMKQEMGFFDMEDHSIGALSTLLSSEIGHVKGLTGDLLGVGINIVGALLCAIIISFVSCWRLTLVVLAILPGVVLGGYFEMQASAGIDSGARKQFSEANMVAAEAVENVATVRSLGVEEHFLSRFNKVLARTNIAKLKKDIITGVAYGFSEFCQFLIWYATFKAGYSFVESGYCEFSEMLLSSMALLFGAITLGNVSVFAPDVASSNVSAALIFRLLSRNSLIDPSREGEKMHTMGGDVSAKRVYFEYPRRPDVPVLRGLSLAIAKGKTLAIVGTSGHGKSTIIGLLEQFYSIRKGEIIIDNQNIAQVKVGDLRSHIGLVPQEPELFNRSVFENIAYGLPHDGSSVVTRELIVSVAKLANAHDFIERLPQKYDTVVGARGEGLSGGQRQRIAIARALVRRPAILLLDEATSALDSASERAVQMALDEVEKGRTTIIVAHRLSTIRHADVIAVVQRGRVVESGTHDILLRKNGAYAKLIENQLSEV